MLILGQLSWANHELYGFHECGLNVALDMLMGKIFKLVISKIRIVHIRTHISSFVIVSLFLIIVRYNHRVLQVWFSEK